MRYYDVRMDAEHYPDRWYLDDPRDERGDELDSREFRYGKKYVGPKPVHLPIYRSGRVVAFDFAGFDMPVVTTEVGNIIAKIAPESVERFPVKVGPKELKGYEILNVTVALKCVDETKSIFQKYPLDDPDPDHRGKYEMFTKLRIDPLAVKGHHIFRIAGWRVVMVVSDEIRKALSGVKDLGVMFEPVTD